MLHRPLRLAFLGDANSVHTRRWIGYFAARGHLVHLLVTADAEVAPGLPAEVRICRLRPYGRRGLRPLGYLDARRAMQAALASIAPDVVHAHYLTGYGWLALVSGFRPYIVTTWGSDVYRSLGSIRNKLLGWVALRRAWLVTADSHDLVRASIAAGARRRRTALIQFGGETERFTDGSADDLRERLGLKGRRVIFAPRVIAPIYRHRVFLEALSALEDDVVAVMSTHEAFPAELALVRAAATELGIADRLVIVPDIPHDEMVGFYRLADAVVSIPVTDATPVSLLEAMAVGRAIVATDLPSVREWLGDLDPEGLVRVDDSAAVVRALRVALGRSPETRKSLAAATRARVEERADHERNMRRMERLYERAAGLRSHPWPDHPPTVEPAGRRRSRAVILVAYFFPPVGGVGSVRLSAHARFLPASGWTPLVLGAAGSPYLLSDATALERLPSDLVIRRARTFEPEHLRPAVTWARTLVGRLTRGRRTDAPWRGDVAGTRLMGGGIRADSPEHSEGFIARARRLIAVPDDQAGWIPDAMRVGRSLVRDGAPDAIFSSSSPISAHIVAGVLARTHHLPWIAEFRDPWLDNPIAGPMGARTRRLQAAIERAIVRRADRIVFVTPSLLAQYAARYPRDADRFELVANGYERGIEAASLLSGPEPGDASFRLVYAGSLYRPGELATFLAGVEQFLSRRPAQRTRLRIEFVGFVSGQCRPLLDAASAAERLGPVVSATGYLPREVALDHVRRAHAALTLLGAGPGAGQFVGAKLYDYIGLDKQVFAMLPEGDARDLLRRLDWGIIVDPEPSSVADGLERLLDAPLPGRPADPGGLYDRARLVSDLGRILDQAVEQGPRRTSGCQPTALETGASHAGRRTRADLGGATVATPVPPLPAMGSREDG